MGLEEIFENMETSAQITSISTTHIQISWTEKGRGFGDYTIYLEDGEWRLDTECDSKESVKRILGTLIDGLPLKSPG